MLELLGFILMYIGYPTLFLSIVALYGLTIKWGHNKSIDKGYGATPGVLLTVFLFFIGYGILCLFPTREKTHRYGLKTYWKCKKCGNYNLDEEKTCSNCGEERFHHHNVEKEENNGQD